MHTDSTVSLSASVASLHGSPLPIFSGHTNLRSRVETVAEVASALTSAAGFCALIEREAGADRDVVELSVIAQRVALDAVEASAACAADHELADAASLAFRGLRAARQIFLTVEIIADAGPAALAREAVLITELALMDRANIWRD
jgi:hypothetical protein